MSVVARVSAGRRLATAGRVLAARQPPVMHFSSSPSRDEPLPFDEYMTLKRKLSVQRWAVLASRVGPVFLILADGAGFALQLHCGGPRRPGRARGVVDGRRRDHERHDDRQARGDCPHHVCPLGLVGGGRHWPD